jgi:hypothetical protein
LLEIRGFPLNLRIFLSDDWIEHKYIEEKESGARLREFRCKNDAAFLGIALRGVEPASGFAAAMRAEFAKPPHQLWPGDVEAVRGCLGELGDQNMFEIAGVRTSSVGGKDALVVEGRWYLAGYDAYDVFVPVTSECTRLQEIYFVAPGDVFQRHIAAIKSAVATVRWTSGDDVTG